jgi:16S rRNA G966 N2-methylase RsmD
MSISIEKELIIKKFGGEYFVDKDTFHMGVHHLLANPIAERFVGHKIVLDSCAGAGFMAIPLSRCVEKVITVDKDLNHLEQAKMNAKIAGVSNKIIFHNNDVLKTLGETFLSIDAAFLDPDWTLERDDKENHVTELSKMVPPADQLIEKVFKKTSNVCLRLPRTFDVQNLGINREKEIQSVFQDNKLKFFCVYFGDLIKEVGKSELRV